jgi:hypothetical protein
MYTTSTQELLVDIAMPDKSSSSQQPAQIRSSLSSQESLYDDLEKMIVERQKLIQHVQKLKKDVRELNHPD